MSALTNGAIYLVNSSRKGTFAGMLVSHDDTWATFEITAGKAQAMLAENEREKGEEVTVRRAFCTFTEQPTQDNRPCPNPTKGEKCPLCEGSYVCLQWWRRQPAEKGGAA